VSQIPLPLFFDRRFSLQNYISADADYIVAQLTGLFDETGEALIGLWGGPDSGKTHLLNACAHYARDSDIPFHLFDGSQLAEARPGQFNTFAPGSVVGIDNLDLIAGDRAWEDQFYDLVNRVQAGEIRLIFSLARQPRDTGFRLPDLKSRLMWGLLVALKAPDDKQLEQILARRAQLLGLKLGKDALVYLLNHYSRRISAQMELLYRLDHASLMSKRKVTVALIREVFEGVDSGAA
jgi:DnaA family protein